MNIFFICSHGFDYVQDLTFRGLVRALGRKCVVDYPWNKKYHLPLWRYPKNMGFSRNLIFSPPRTKSWIKETDVVIVGSAKADAFRALLSCIRNIPKSIPLILLDGGDLESIGGDLKREDAFDLFLEAQAIRPFDLVFKREMVEDRSYPAYTRPYPLSFCTDYSPTAVERKVFQVAFWGVESNPIRTSALRSLEGKFDCDENGTQRNQSFSKYKRKGAAYFRALAECEIVLSFWGAGYEALRFWEALGVGSFLLTQRPKIQMPHPFRSGEHLVYLDDDIGDLIEKCHYYLAHIEKREAIAKSGNAHLLSHHTTRRRVDFLLREIQRI